MEKTYSAKEAYTVMEYQCDSCGHKEPIYNVRDSVTPFGIGCRNCEKGTMRHINWERDRRVPEDFTVPPGALMFIDHTPDSALEVAKKRVANADGSEFELQGQAREDMIYSIAEQIMEDCCSCQIVRADAADIEKRAHAYKTELKEFISSIESAEEYISSIEALVKLAYQDTSGARAAAQVLLSAYNGYAFQLDVTDLCVLDGAHLEYAIAVIKGRATLSTEPQKLLADGDAVFKTLWDRWSDLHVNSRCEH